MDFLVAVQVYNKTHSRLAGLPDALITNILHRIGEDILTLYCVRRVSRKFRRLINKPEIWRYTNHPLSQTRLYITEIPWAISEHNSTELRRRLQADGLCRLCKVVSARTCGRGMCRFKRGDNGVRNCAGCGTQHNAWSFPIEEQRTPGETRRCLGRQGAVKLCEHVGISWAGLHHHIEDWQRREPGNWVACLEAFEVVYRDVSHDTRCRSEGEPTCQRARLRMVGDGDDGVMLSLEWSPHSGMFGLTDGVLYAEELRGIFTGYRKGPAAYLFPAYPANPLPEMACFGGMNCRCVRYERVGSRRETDAVEPRRSILSRGSELQAGGSDHRYRRFPKTSHMGGSSVEVDSHRLVGDEGPVCLVTTYKRDVTVFRTGGLAKLNPGKDWFHAMDPDSYTYSYPFSLGCRDERCTRYYRRPGVFACY